MEFICLTYQSLIALKAHFFNPSVSVYLVELIEILKKIYEQFQCVQRKKRI